MAESPRERRRVGGVVRTAATLTETPRRYFVALAAVALVAGLVEAALLAAVAQAATMVAADQETTSLPLPTGAVQLGLTQVLLGAVGLVAGRLALLTVSAVIPARLLASRTILLRRRLLNTYLSTDWTRQLDVEDGRLQELSMSQTGKVVGVISATTSGLTALTSLVALTAVALAIAPVAALGLVVLAVSLAAALRPLGRAMRIASQRNADAVLDYSRRLVQVVRVSAEVKVFGVAQEQLEDTLRPAVTAGHAFGRTQLYLRLAPGVYQSAAIVMVLAVLAAGALGAVGEIGALGAVVLLMLRSLGYGQLLQTVQQQVQDAAPYVHGVAAFLAELPGERSDGPGGRQGAPLSPVREGVTLQGVSYRHKGARGGGISGVSFELPPASLTAVVGGVGRRKEHVASGPHALKTPPGRGTLGRWEGPRLVPPRSPSSSCPTGCRSSGREPSVECDARKERLLVRGGSGLAGGRSGA